MSERKCGPCQLCCRVMPIVELGSEANMKCPHQRFRKGCAIYDRRPPGCQVWQCAWLAHPELAELKRPDLAGYVIDLTMDFLTLALTDNSTVAIKIIQIWCDSRRPDAHRDRALRDYLEAMFAQEYIGVVRHNSKSGIALIPPEWSGKGWVELPAQGEGREHKLEEYLAKFGTTDYRLGVVCGGNSNEKNNTFMRS